MRMNLLTRRPSRGFPLTQCAITLLCSAFCIEPLVAQELDWPSNGNDVGGMRYANIDQITPANVSQLKPAWTFHTGVLNSAQPGLTLEMSPLVVDGVMYVTSGVD